MRAHTEIAWREEPGGDVVCEHGTAIDVHCCNCHHGFLFDGDTCECDFDDDVPAWSYGAALLVAFVAIAVAGGFLYGAAKLLGAW